MNSQPQSGPPTAAGAPATDARRLASLDALRGFDMFWIIGTEGVVHALAEMTGWSLLIWGSVQLQHVPWDGFSFYDMIFPLFLFIAGAAMPFSLTQRRERGHSKSRLALQLLRRALLLAVLGVVYNALPELYSKGPLWVARHLGELRYSSVLGRIGLASLLAGLIVLNFSIRGQIVWFVVLLVGYWAAMTLVPVPGYGAGNLTRKGNLAAWVDRHITPGRLRSGAHDPVGPFTTIPAVGTALLGVFAGTILRHKAPDRRGGRQAVLLAVFGAVSLAAGWLWGRAFPINKNLWTSSYVLYAGGWSLLLLAFFYATIDVWGKRRWAFFFIVIGMNSILVYLIEPFLSFGLPVDFLLKLWPTMPSPAVTKLVRGVLVVAVEWLILWYLYRKKLFLKV